MLIYLVVLLILCFFTLFLSVILLQKRRNKKEILRYTYQFDFKEVHSAILFDLAWLLFGVLFLGLMVFSKKISFFNINKEFNGQTIIFLIGEVLFYVTLLLILIYSVKNIIGHLNIYLEVNNDEMIIRDQSRKVYKINTKNIRYIKFEDRKNSTNKLFYMHFKAEGKERYISMIVSWGNFLLLHKFRKIYKIPSSIDEYNEGIMKRRKERGLEL